MKSEGKIFGIAMSLGDVCLISGTLLHLTLIYPANFEDVPCQSGVNHIFEG